MNPLDFWDKKNIAKVNVHSHSYIEAIAKAKETIEIFVAFFKESNSEDFSFFIKKRFEDGQFAEHLWIRPTAYNDGNFVGEVDNEPNTLTNVFYKQKVTVNKEEVEDWIVAKQSEILMGNFIGNIIQS